MSTKDKEHYDLMDAFEKLYGYKNLPKESKEIWNKAVYCNGEINRQFFIFRSGYMLGKSIASEDVDA